VRHLLTLLLCLLAIAAPVRALAADAARVVLVRVAGEDGWPAAEDRTRAELRGLGLGVVEEPGTAIEPDARRAELGALAQKHGAVASVRIVRSGRGGDVDVWLVDKVTGKTTLRQIQAKDLRGGDAAALVALRVVELLNASLLELKASHESRGDVEASKDVERLASRVLVPREATRFGVRAGLVAAGSPGGLGPMGGLLIAGTYAPLPALALDLDLHGTVLPTSVTDGRVQVRVGLAWARVHLVYRPWPEAIASPGLAVGGGGMLAWSTGHADPPLSASNETTFVGLPSAGIDLPIRLGSRLRVHLGVRASVAVPEVSVQVEGEELATAGRPLIDGTRALEWVWPR
jgi:hypothetical protein